MLNRSISLKSSPQLARPASMQSNAARERKEQRANYTLKRVTLKTSDVKS